MLNITTEILLVWVQANSMNVAHVS